MYADRVSASMQRTIDETTRLRLIQEQYNVKHGIAPTGISREIGDMLPHEAKPEVPKLDLKKISKDE